MLEMQVQPLGQEDPLEKEMAILSSILAWRRAAWQAIQSMGLQRVRHNRAMSIVHTQGYVLENNSHINGLWCHPAKWELYSKGNSKPCSTKEQKSDRATPRLLAMGESSGTVRDQGDPTTLPSFSVLYGSPPFSPKQQWYPINTQHRV